MAGRISTEDNTVRKLELPLQYLKDITDNFSSDREIGRGGFGVVYKGMEPQSEVVIAVKKLKPILGGQDKQFKNEVNHLARLSHDNIVKLVGYCDETKERPVYDEYQQKYILAEVQDRLLCYEYMSKGSLDKYIFDESIGLDWQDRYKIINGICQGLYCLHEGLDNTPIIHMDLKPCNILLDDRMEPKIADFGLSRFFSEEQTRTCTMNVIGSIGYMAPEYLHRGDISTKSDIYSLGILILEVVTGKKNSHVAGNMSGEHFIENVRKNWTEMSQIVLKYPSLGTDCHHQVHRCIETGLRCAEANPETRPSAGQILLHIFSGKSTSADKVDQETIKKQVASMYLWPKTLEVPIMDPSKASKRPVGILLVKVVRAQNLRKKNLLGKSDPYVELKMSDDKLPSKKTTVKRSNLNPEWNEEFKFLVTDPENQALEVNVFNWELVGKHERMGMNMIPLRELPPEETKVTTLNLLNTMDPNDVQNEKSRGQLTLELTYKPFKEEDMEKEDTEGADVIEKAPDGTPAGGGLLYVIVHGAQDLEGKHHTNPYAKIIFKGEAKKTRAIKKNRDPRWEDEFEFVCEEPPVNDKLHVEVLSKAGKIGLIHGKETLGYIYISLADVISNKRINEKYYLIDSKNGQIQIELKWRTS